MKIYIGTKIIQAEPMSERYFLKEFKGVERPDADRFGYRVIYSDGYVSWSPEEVFEAAYREISVKERWLLRSDEEQTEGGGE